MPESDARTQLQQFLTTLWPDGLDGSWALFWGAPSKQSLWTEELTPTVLDTLMTWGAKENVYVGCGLRRENLGATLRGDRESVVAIPGLWLDIDYGKEHKKPNLPPTEAEALALIRDMGPSPSLIVHSGRGLQAWWAFKEPWVFDGEADRAKAEQLTKGWSSTLRARAKAKGWDADQVGDLPRVMRLPGLWNHKGKRRPTVLQAVADPMLRYNPGDFDAFLSEDTGGAAKPVAQVSWKFELNPDANPPAEKFAALMELDHRFKLAWQHNRTDFQDQSLNVYDLALATRAFIAGWNGQEIVDLLLAHRKKYNGDPEKSRRRDYFERTLNVAISGKEEETRRQNIADFKAGKPIPEETLNDPAEVRAFLSEQLGVPIQKVIRYRNSGEGNNYTITVAGVEVDVASIEDIESQTKFRRLIYDHTGIRPLPFKPMEWHNFLNHFSRIWEDVDGSMASKRSNYTAYIEHYLTTGSSGVADESAWQDACLRGDPFMLDGHTWVPTFGLLRHILTQCNDKLTTKQLCLQLIRLGFEHDQKKLRNRKGTSTTRGCWRVR